MKKSNLFIIFMTVIFVFVGVFFSSGTARVGGSPLSTSIPTPTPIKIKSIPCAIATYIATRPCKKWAFSLLKNITSDFPQNQQFYISKFPENCYVNSQGNFVCYWKNPESACKAQVEDRNFSHPSYTELFKKIERVNSEYYNCYTIDSKARDKPANYYLASPIRYENAEPQPHCATQINGPYSALPDDFFYCNTQYAAGQSGFDFTQTQKNKIKQVNKQFPSNGNKIRSDLAGFKYSYNGQTFTEPDFLTETPLLPNSVEVHHIVPRKDKQSCSCGANSVKNAALISRQLNQFLTNNPRTTVMDMNTGMSELDFIQAKPKYPYP